jgi:hypothetical protein
MAAMTHRSSRIHFALEALTGTTLGRVKRAEQ